MFYDDIVINYRKYFRRNNYKDPEFKNRRPRYHILQSRTIGKIERVNYRGETWQVSGVKLTALCGYEYIFDTVLRTETHEINYRPEVKTAAIRCKKCDKKEEQQREQQQQAEATTA